MTAQALRAKLLEADPALDHQRVDLLIAQVEEDQSILRAGLEWASTGNWPEEPAAETWTPARIATFLGPASVLSALLDLRADPSGAARTLGEMWIRAHPRGPRSTNPFDLGWPGPTDPDRPAK